MSACEFLDLINAYFCHMKSFLSHLTTDLRVMVMFLMVRSRVLTWCINDLAAAC